MSNILETDGEQLLQAVLGLLAKKGIASPLDIQAQIASTDNATPGQGARMVAKAWTDPDYRALMLEDGTNAAEALDIPLRTMERRFGDARRWLFEKLSAPAPVLKARGTT